MAGGADAQDAGLADYLIERYGPFAAKQACELAKEAHRREDYVAEACWWSIAARLRAEERPGTVAA